MLHIKTLGPVVLRPEEAGGVVGGEEVMIHHRHIQAHRLIQERDMAVGQETGDKRVGGLGFGLGHWEVRLQGTWPVIERADSRRQRYREVVSGSVAVEAIMAVDIQEAALVEIRPVLGAVLDMRVLGLGRRQGGSCSRNTYIGLTLDGLVVTFLIGIV
jgi:hypothetical protein